MSTPSLAYIRATMEGALRDVDVADQKLRELDHDSAKVTVALWRLDFVRHACERVLEEITSGFPAASMSTPPEARDASGEDGPGPRRDEEAA